VLICCLTFKHRKCGEKWTIVRGCGKTIAKARKGGTKEQDNKGKVIKLILDNTLRTGDADLRFYITTVQDG
jgi:hypothetical protein